MGLSSQLAPSAIAKPGVCTSSTRPASPYEGQVIYETDTDASFVWTGAKWVGFANPGTPVTSLPSSPADGQIIDYVADSTNGIIWRFRYRSASSSAYKWEFIGGPPAISYVGPNNYYGSRETTTSTTFTDLATVGPSFTTPFAGDWDCGYSLKAETSGTSINVRIFASGDGSTSWNLGDSASYVTSGAFIDEHTVKVRRTGLASGSTIKVQYAVSNAGVTAYFWDRRLYVTPVRVG